MEFQSFPKIPRLSRDMVITEKLDGTCSLIYITEDNELYTGSKHRWIIPDNDNHGFARWASDNIEELRKLGPGRHFGEWWGQDIQRGYGLKEKRFSLFNTDRWSDDQVRPACCHVVPILWEGIFSTEMCDIILRNLIRDGSSAAPGFMRPEGIVVFHVAGNLMFKKTIEKDNEPKGKAI